MRAVYCSNFDHMTTTAELKDLFLKHGRIERIVKKSTFAFVYFEDQRDARDAIHDLNNMPFGLNNRKLAVEWAKGEPQPIRCYSDSISNQRPNKTLFVSNIDSKCTKSLDIRKHFEAYGAIVNVRMHRRFALVKFHTQEEATKAFKYAHKSKISGTVVSVVYARKKGDRSISPRRDYGRSGYSASWSRGGRSNSPRWDYGRRGYGASRSRGSRSNSPRRDYGRRGYSTSRSRGSRSNSPRRDYGRRGYSTSRSRGSRSNSPRRDYGRRGYGASQSRDDRSNSPRRDYGRRGHGASRRSPSPAHHCNPLSRPDSGRAKTRTRSPDYGRYSGPCMYTDYSN